MYYSVIKHCGHLRTLEKCRKHEPQASVFYKSLVFSMPVVSYQFKTRVRLLYLLKKNNKEIIVNHKGTRMVKDGED